MKYELTDETKIFFGRTLHRIKATKDFEDVRAGELGGWIEKEENLSQDGNCWVDGNAWVSGNASVWGNARVGGSALVGGSAQVSGSAQVGGSALVGGSAQVGGNARVSDSARVGGNAWVGGNARVWGSAWVSGNASVWGKNHVLRISPIGSRDDTVTFMRTKDHKIAVSVGCFYGSVDEFERAVLETHGNNEHAQAYKLAIELAKLRIDLKGDIL